MSHYDDEAEVSWAVLTEWKPDREMVTADEASLFEKRVSGNVFEAQTNPNRRIQWAAFFSTLQESILTGFSIDSTTQTVFEDDSLGVDDCYWDFKQEIENDDIVSSLYRLNVPFRAFIVKSHSESDMQFPQVVFHLFSSSKQLERVPPEPLEVLLTREDGDDIVSDVNSFFTESTDSVSLLEWVKFLERELSTREELLLQYAVPFTPEKSEEGFEEAIEVGENRLQRAEELSEVAGIEIF